MLAGSRSLAPSVAWLDLKVFFAFLVSLGRKQKADSPFSVSLCCGIENSLVWLEVKPYSSER